MGKVEVVKKTGRPAATSGDSGNVPATRAGQPAPAMGNFRINQALVAAGNASGIEAIIKAHASNFNLINCATALHRLAKCTKDGYESKESKELAKVTSRLLSEHVSHTGKGQPVNFKTLTSIAWAMGKLKQAAIAKPLMSICSKRLPELDSQGIANILWALACVGYTDQKVLVAVLSAARQSMSKFNPQELTNLAWACATIRLNDVRFMTTLSRAIQSSIGQFQPQGLANCAWAYAKLAILDTKLLGVIAHAALAKVDTFDTQSMANIVWAYARLGHSDLPLAIAIAKKAAGAAEEFTTQGLACAMWGFANTQGHTSTTGDTQVGHQPKVDGMAEGEHEEQDAFVVSEATAEEEIEQHVPAVDERLEGVISRLGSELERRAGDMDAQQVVYALTAIAKLRDVSSLAGLARVISARMVHAVADMSAQDLGVSTWALVKLGRFDKDVGADDSQELVDAVCAHALKVSEQLNWRSIGHMELFLRCAGVSEPSAVYTALSARARYVVAQVNAESKAINAAPGAVLAALTPSPCADLPSGARILLVDGDDTVEGALTSQGFEVSHWHRHAGHSDCAAWPGVTRDTSYDACIVRYPSTADAFKAPVWVYGLVREGIASVAGANTVLRPLYMNVRTVVVEKMSVSTDGTLPSAGHTCTVQVIGCLRGAAAVKGSRDTLAGWAKDPDVTVYGKTLSWRVYPGLFAGGTLDIMTGALLDALPAPPPHARVLDFASGSGVIAAALRIKDPTVKTYLLDNDAAAMEAARRNVPDAEDYTLADGWQSQSDLFDWVVSNPPVHAGQPDDFSVLEELIQGAHKQLRAGGMLYIVAQEQVPVGRMLALCGAYAHVTATMSPDKRFITWCATVAGKAKVGKGGESKGKKEEKRKGGDKRKSIEVAVAEPGTQSKKKKRKEKRAESKKSKKRKAATDQATETQPKKKKAKSESGTGADGVLATATASGMKQGRRDKTADQIAHDTGDEKKSKKSEKSKKSKKEMRNGEDQGEIPKIGAEKKTSKKKKKKATQDHE